MIPDWTTERRQMVDQQLRRRGIRDERVLFAMGQIPRQDFVPSESRVMAYSDAPIPVGLGQTVSQPYMTALMAELLELRGAETVLEIGAGSGYAAAVLGKLASQVVSVEVRPSLVQLARENLRRSGCGINVTVVEADGSYGFPAGAPFPAISVAAAPREVPPALLDQLGDPGILVIPVGEGENQELRVIRKQRGQIDSRIATLCRFVPLRQGGDRA